MSEPVASDAALRALVERFRPQVEIARANGAAEDVANWRLALTPREFDQLAAALAVRAPVSPPEYVAENEIRRLQRRINWLEGTEMPHARKQENANGFQKGWHAALARMSGGEDFEVLSRLVPEPCVDVDDTLPAPVSPPEEDTTTTRAHADDCLCGACAGDGRDTFPVKWKSAASSPAVSLAPRAEEK